MAGCCCRCCSRVDPTASQDSILKLMHEEASSEQLSPLLAGLGEMVREGGHLRVQVGGVSKTAEADYTGQSAMSMTRVT